MAEATPSNTSEPHIAHTLLSRAHSPTTTNNLFTDRVVKRPLTLRPTSPTPSVRAVRRSARAAREAVTKARQSKKPRPLSAAQKRALCLYEIPKEQQKYAIYEPLHQLWCGYMREVLGLVRAEGEQGTAAQHVTPAGAGPMVASADLHGAAIEVVRSRCVSRVGLKGIVVRDTKFVFDIVTRGDVVKTVPKEHTIFRIEVPFVGVEQEDQQQQKPLAFEIHGEHVQRTAPDRAKKSFKMHFVPDL